MMFYSNRAKAQPKLILKVALAYALWTLRFVCRAPLAVLAGTVVAAISAIYTVAWFIFFWTPKKERREDNASERATLRELWGTAREIYAWAVVHQ